MVATADSLAARRAREAPEERAPFRPASAWRRHWRALVAGAVVVVAALAITSHLRVAAATVDAGAELRAARTAAAGHRTATATALADAAVAETAVVEVRARLDTLRADTRATASETAAVLAQRDELLLALGAGEDDLRAASSALQESGDVASARAGRIGALRACLDGVNQALNLTAMGDRHGARAALGRVAASCDAAGVAP